MSRGRRNIQPYAVIDPGAVEELIGGDGWYITYISTQTETLSGALEGMGTLTLPKVDAITAVKNSNGKVILLGVGNATHDARTTQYESLLNSHHLRSNGVDVQDISRRHGGLQRLEIKVGQEINYIPLDFDGEIMKINLRTPTLEEIETMEVTWLTPAMGESNLRSVRRSVSVRSSYELVGTGNDAVQQAEVSTSTPATVENKDDTSKGVMDWKATLGYPNEKVLKKTLETTTQLCAGPVEMEQREIPRQHKKNGFYHYIPSDYQAGLTAIHSSLQLNQLGVTNVSNSLFTSPPILFSSVVCNVSLTHTGRTRILYGKSEHLKSLPQTIHKHKRAKSGKLRAGQL